MYLVGVLVVVLGVVVSIALHEIGHLVPAKRFGVKCSQYMIGFGPTLWSRRVGETEYGVKAIPLGRLRADDRHVPPAAGRLQPPATATGRWALLAEQARQRRAERGRPRGRRPALLPALGPEAPRHHARRPGR